jgi:hypothetical protein
MHSVFSSLSVQIGMKECNFISTIEFGKILGLLSVPGE